MLTNQAEVTPCEYEAQPLQKELPSGGRCEVVYVDYGADRLAVALDPLDVDGKPVAEANRLALTKILQQIDLAPSSLVKFVENTADADWLVRLDDQQVLLLPAANLLDARAPFGPVKIDVDLEIWLADSLRAIARAENLKRLAAAASDEIARGDLAVKLEVTIDRETKPGTRTPVEWQRSGLGLYDGDPVTVHIKNPGLVPIDVTLLYVDNAYGIDSLFPESGETNRILPGEKISVDLAINGTTTGLEHVVVIAVKGEGSLVDFSSLKQRTVERQRGGSTPLGQLLNSAVYRQGTTRGAGRKALNDYALRLISWKVASEKRPVEVPPK